MVTFPMLPEARATASDDEAALAHSLAETFRQARDLLA